MSETVATAQWRALDRDGEDKCRLVRVGDGWMLVGHARFRDGHGWAALDYVIRLGNDWLTLGADITGTHGGEDIGLRITRDPKVGWTLNDVPHPDLADCDEIDLSFTPATNLMPLRRLPEVGRLVTRSAWLRLPGPLISPLTQTYLRERGNLVRYAAAETGYKAEIKADAHGFVTLYPGLWERVDDPA